MALVVAHRGYASKYPENTLLSLKKAVDLGVDAVEFDVRKSKDGVLFVFHDAILWRTTGRIGFIENLPYSKIINLKVHGQEKIPLLDDVLKYLSKTKLKNIFLELKSDGIEEIILNQIKKFKIHKKIIIISYKYNHLFNIRKMDNTIRLGYSFHFRPFNRAWKKAHKELKLYSVQPYYNNPFFNDNLISELRKHGVLSLPWLRLGSHTDKKIKKLLSRNIDGILTDYPLEMIRHVRL